MNYDDRTVVEYAERRLKDLRSQKLVFPIMGVLLLGLFVCLIWMICEKSEKIGESLVGNPAFWAGFGIGILFMMTLFLGALGLVKTFRISWGIEAAVYDLAVRLGRENLR